MLLRNKKKGISFFLFGRTSILINRDGDADTISGLSIGLLFAA